MIINSINFTKMNKLTKIDLFPKEKWGIMLIKSNIYGPAITAFNELANSSFIGSGGFYYYSKEGKPDVCVGPISGYIVYTPEEFLAIYNQDYTSICNNLDNKLKYTLY